MIQTYCQNCSRVPVQTPGEVCLQCQELLKRAHFGEPVSAAAPSPAVASFSQPHSYFTRETGWTKAGIAEQERRAKIEPVPDAQPSPAVSDAPTKWTEGPWTYRPIPGYQFVIEILHTKEPLRLTACSVPPGREAEVREVLTLAAAAPDLYTTLQNMLAITKYAPKDSWIMPIIAAARKALQLARGEHA